MLARSVVVGSLLVAGQPQLRGRSKAQQHITSQLFPGGDDFEYTPPSGGGGDAPNAWRKGKLELGGDYWFRETASGEPEISLTDPNEGWKVGVLPNGQEYVWKEGADEEGEPQVELLGEGAMEQDEEGGGVGEWNVATLPSGREYLWRQVEGEDEPEVRLWFQSTLDSGAPFWYDDTGEITLSDPFESARRGEPIIFGE